MRQAGIRRRIVMALGLAALLRGQSTPPYPAFDVASVRRSKTTLPPMPPGGPDTPPAPPPPPGFVTSPTGIMIENAPLKYCLTWAYGVQNWQVSGPSWIDGIRYDISAKTGSPVETGQLKLMLQALLTERFRMTVRRETKVSPVLALVQMPGGSKLAPSKPGTASTRKMTQHMPMGVSVVAENMPLEMIVQLLTFPSRSGTRWWTRPDLPAGTISRSTGRHAIRKTRMGG